MEHTSRAAGMSRAGSARALDLYYSLRQQLWISLVHPIDLPTGFNAFIIIIISSIIRIPYTNYTYGQRHVEFPSPRAVPRVCRQSEIFAPRTINSDPFKKLLLFPSLWAQLPLLPLPLSLSSRSSFPLLNPIT